MPITSLHRNALEASESANRVFVVVTDLLRLAVGAGKEREKYGDATVLVPTGIELNVMNQNTSDVQARASSMAARLLELGDSEDDALVVAAYLEEHVKFFVRVADLSDKLDKALERVGQTAQEALVDNPDGARSYREQIEAARTDSRAMGTAANAVISEMLGDLGKLRGQ